MYKKSIQENPAVNHYDQDRNEIILSYGFQWTFRWLIKSTNTLMLSSC